jgi:hypothetical protein
MKSKLSVLAAVLAVAAWGHAPEAGAAWKPNASCLKKCDKVRGAAQKRKCRTQCMKPVAKKRPASPAPAAPQRSGEAAEGTSPADAAKQARRAYCFKECGKTTGNAQTKCLTSCLGTIGIKPEAIQTAILMEKHSKCMAKCSASGGSDEATCRQCSEIMLEVMKSIPKPGEASPSAGEPSADTDRPSPEDAAKQARRAYCFKECGKATGDAQTKCLTSCLGTIGIKPNQIQTAILMEKHSKCMAKCSASGGSDEATCRQCSEIMLDVMKSIPKPGEAAPTTAPSPQGSTHQPPTETAFQKTRKAYCLQSCGKIAAGPARIKCLDSCLGTIGMSASDVPSAVNAP